MWSAWRTQEFPVSTARSGRAAGYFLDSSSPKPFAIRLLLPPYLSDTCPCALEKPSVPHGFGLIASNQNISKDSLINITIEIWKEGSIPILDFVLVPRSVESYKAVWPCFLFAFSLFVRYFPAHLIDNLPNQDVRMTSRS
jgi:hypothetical protein